MDHDSHVKVQTMGNTKLHHLFILVFALLVVMLGFGMVIPVFPVIIDRLSANGSALGILVVTRQIHNGQIVTVDGIAGTVMLG